MSDEAPHIEDTPATSSPTSDTPEIPWQKRYEDLRPEFDRTKQELAAWDDEQTALQKLAEKYPHLFEEGDEDTEEVSEDFEDPRDAEIAALKQQIGQVTTWQQDVENERGARRFESDLKATLGDDVTVSARQKDWIKDRTVALGNNKKALEQAVGEYKEILTELQAQHLQQVTSSKKTSHTPAGGSAGTQVPNLDDPQERHAFLRQRAAEVGAANRR